MGSWKNKNIAIIVFVLVIIMGLTGLFNTVLGDEPPKGESVLRLQDKKTTEWPEDSQGRNPYFVEEHYILEPFTIYLYSAKKQVDTYSQAKRTTTFTIKLIDKTNKQDEKVIKIFDPVIIKEGETLTEEDITLTIPYSGEWYLTIDADEKQYQDNQNNTHSIYLSGGLNLKKPVVVINPSNPMIDIGETQQFTATLKKEDGSKLLDGNGNPVVIDNNLWKWSIVEDDDNKDVANLVNASSGTYKGLKEGSVTVKAEYGDTGLSGTTTLKVSSLKNYHLAVIPYPDHSTTEHTFSVPELTIRSGSTGSTWGYIGEQMSLDVKLEIRDEHGIVVENYDWGNQEYFYDPSIWRITFSSNNATNEEITPISSIRMQNVTYNGSALTATINITTDNNNIKKINIFNNFNVKINPIDQNGYELKDGPAVARVINYTDVNPRIEGGPYNLYRGRIRVADKDFHKPDGQVMVFVEKYKSGEGNGVQYETNEADYTTSVNFHNDILDPSTQTIKFKKGVAKVDIYNNTDDLYKKLGLVSDIVMYPGYFAEPYPGLLTWQQLPKNSKGIIWEKEVL